MTAERVYGCALGLALWVACTAIAVALLAWGLWPFLSGPFR